MTMIQVYIFFYLIFCIFVIIIVIIDIFVFVFLSIRSFLDLNTWSLFITSCCYQGNVFVDKRCNRFSCKETSDMNMDGCEIGNVTKGMYNVAIRIVNTASKFSMLINFSIWICYFVDMEDILYTGGVQKIHISVLF